MLCRSTAALKQGRSQPDTLLSMPQLQSCPIARSQQASSCNYEAGAKDTSLPQAPQTADRRLHSMEHCALQRQSGGRSSSQEARRHKSLPPKMPLPVAQLLAPVLVSASVPPATAALNPLQHDE